MHFDLKMLVAGFVIIKVLSQSPIGEEGKTIPNNKIIKK